MAATSAEASRKDAESHSNGSTAPASPAELFPFHYIDGAPDSDSSAGAAGSCASASASARQSHVRLRCAGSSPPPLASLTGRAHQRFDGSVRLVCGCVPFRVDRVRTAAPDGEQGGAVRTELSVLLVNAQKRGDFIFPKGGWEEFETAPCCAQRECLEEGGVEGDVVARLPPIEFASKAGHATRLLCFLLRVHTLHQSWAECDKRSRKWVPLAQVEAEMQRAETKQVWAAALRALKQAGFIDQDGNAVFQPAHCADQTQDESAATTATTAAADEASETAADT